MPTTAPARPAPKKPAKHAPKKGDSPLLAMQHAVEDLEKRVNAYMDDLRKRVEHDGHDWRAAIDEAGSDALREIGVRAVRLQRDPKALTAITTAVRERRSELRATK